MTINSETRVAGPFDGNDSTVSFPFTFKVFDSDEVRVVAETGAVETDLELGTDYTVTLNADQNAAPGGSVVLTAPLPTGSRLTLTSALEMLQPVDLTNQGGFYPRVINSALDRLTILLQQLASVVSRTLKFPLSDGPVGDLPGRSARAGTVLAFDEATGEPVAGPDIASVNGVAGALVAVNTVANNIADVNTVADNIADVNAVGQNIANVNAVADNSANVNTVADNIADVNTVADNITDLSNFFGVYYGPSATDPTTRRDGSPLQVGDLYFNTVTNALRTYNGSAWRDSVSGAVTVQNFSGNGVETEFLLDYAPGSEVITNVFVNGVYQQKNTYSLGGANGDVLIFDVAPPVGADNIEVVVSSLMPSDDKLRQDLSGAGGSALVGHNAGTVADALAETVGIRATDTWEEIKSKIESAQEGSRIVFAPGNYVTEYRSPTNIANWIVIQKSGITLEATPGSVTLENFLILVLGSAGPLIPVGAGFTSGDRTINSATAHMLQPGDYVQVVSGINAYTPDAGSWQLGSRNPTTNVLQTTRFAEIHQVVDVPTATTATIAGNIVYPGYAPNTTGQSQPMAGISGAELRKLTPVVGTTFRGIKFRNVENSNFRGILARVAVETVFDQCVFEAGELTGGHLRTTDCSGITFTRCRSYRNTPYDGSGSSWNSFLLAGGSQHILYQGCNFEGEAQSLDITPYYNDGLPGSTSNDMRCDYVTSQFLSVQACSFINCRNAATSHPGTYSVRFEHNVVEGGLGGFLVRSLRSTIAGNSIRTTSSGISLTGFHDQTSVTGNTLTQLPTNPSTEWAGVRVGGLSSDVMNLNNLQNVSISNNTFIRTKSSPVTPSFGVRFRHAGDGVPDSAEFTLFDDTIKTNLSGYRVANNKFFGCGVTVNRWNNGVEIVENSFSGGADQTHYIQVQDNAARALIDENQINDTTNGTAACSTGAVTYPAFTYLTGHATGRWKFRSGMSFGTNLQNIDQMRLYSLGNVIQDGLTLVHNAPIKAIRTSGVATLLLDAVPQDGSSASGITMFSGSTTSGTKTLTVQGNVAAHNTYARTDNTYTLGTAVARWSTVYAGTGTINTSDERAKQQVKPIDDAALRAWGRVEYVQYKFNDAVEQKGDGARWHFGVIAQRVKEAFEAEGLDAFEYGLLCYDEWAETPAVEEQRDDEGNVVVDAEPYRPAGNRYGIRYEEALAIECAYLRSRLAI